MAKTEQGALRAADPSLFTTEELKRLLEAARAASVAYDRYHTACLRLSIERGIENVKAAEWDDATHAACDESNRASDVLKDIAAELFPQALRTAAWADYYERFYGAGAHKAAP